MKKLVLLLVILLPGFLSYSQENINRLSLDDVIYIAQQQSPEALIAKHRFRRSYWEYRTYKANYLPSLRLDGTIPNFNRSIDKITQNDGTDIYRDRQYSNSSLNLSVNQNVGFTGGQLFLSSGLQRLDNFTDSTTQTSYLSTPVNIGYSQPILKYNPYKWDKKIEPLKYDLAGRQYLEDMEDVAITATNHFFNLLLAQIEKNISVKNYHNYDTLFKIATGRYVLGKIAENELLQLELNLLRAEASLETAQLNLEDNLFRLKSFLRIQDEIPVELIPPKETYHFPVESAKAIDEGKNNTSTALDFQRRMLQAESEVNRAKLDNRFDAELYAVFGLTQTANLVPEAYKNPLDQQQVSLGIHIPILDWGLAKGNIRMAESSRELTRTSIEQEQIDFEQNIFLTVMKFNMQKNQLLIAAKADTVAQKRFEVTQKRYMIGKVNDVLELNNAQIDNDNAKKDYFRALQQYWLNYYDLRKLTLYDFRQNQPIKFDISEIGYLK
ncbi:MAG: TolC family protein [Bacteroidetes bacterium]|nr:TolC family protein [Bacteroidota bacterium]